LDAEHNKLIDLPPAVGCLPNLTLLVLSDNKLKDLPDELVLLESLTELKVDGNPLDRIPDADQGGNAVFQYIAKRAAKAKNKRRKGKT